MRIKPKNAKIAIAYIRVSTEEQALGVEAQRAALESWAAKEGVQIDSWHVDRGVSGATPAEQREGLLGAINAIAEKNAGFLLVAKRDRLARDVVISALVERSVRKMGACVYSVDGSGNGSTPADELMRTILDGSAVYERQMIGLRTKAALAAKKARGERTSSRIPYGFKVPVDGKTLSEEPTEQRIIKLARELTDSHTLSEIVGVLTRSGFRSRNGKEFTSKQIHRMVA